MGERDESEPPKKVGLETPRAKKQRLLSEWLGKHPNPYDAWKMKPKLSPKWIRKKNQEGGVVTEQ